MNNVTRQTQQKKISTHDMAKLNSDSSRKNSIIDNAPDSLWSNFRYGLGMVAIIIIPPLIPGSSVRLLIMGYMLLIISIYGVAAIASAMETFGYTKSVKRGRQRVNHRKVKLAT